jgi:hypothetical protein
MKPLRLCLAATLMLAATAAPGQASTLPTLDMDLRHPLTVSTGVFNVGVDMAVSENAAVGSLVGLFTGVAARGTWRVAGAPDQPSWGLTLGGGSTLTNMDAFGWVYARGNNLWLSPALVGSLPLGAGPKAFFWVTLRGTLGPGYILRPSDNAQGLFALVNAELAFAFRNYGEITVGGNSIAGFRARF